MSLWGTLSRLAVAALAATALTPVGAAHAAEVFTIHLSPTGTDSNTGLSADSPIRTLARAQAVLAASKPQTDVEIRIKQGVYVAAPLVWNTYVPGRTITFLPIDYQYGEGVGGIAGRPVFRGNGTSGYWLSARLPSGHPDGATRLRFYYLQVERYDNGGLQLRGGTGQDAQGITRPTNAGVNHNLVFGMRFTELGSAYGSATGYGAVNLQNSSDNVIHNSHFVRIVNDSHEAGLVHGVYAAHHSNRNHIVANDFSYVSGDPVRTRNDSNDTIAEDNTMVRSGAAASYSEWFCDAACVSANPGHGRECASHGNIFRRNNTGLGYSGGSISLWRLTPPGLDTTGGSGCTNDGQVRLRTSDNTAAASRVGAAETAGPRVTPGVAGAVCDTTQDAGERLLAAGTYANYSVPAGVTVKPRSCAQVTFTGQIDVGNGSRVYGITFASPGSWSIRDSAANVTVEHSTFRGNPGIEHVRVEGAGWLVRGNRFEGNPTNHAVKVDGRNALTGGAVIADNLFTGAPGEDAIQYEGHEGTTNQIVHNRFQGAGVEDHVDLKSGSDIVVAWNQFAPTNQGECLLFQNGTGLSVAEHNVFEAGGCFLSFGANGQDVRGRAVANTFQGGSTLRLRESYDLLIAQNTMDGGTIRVGLSGSDDPRSPYFRDNVLTTATSVVDGSQFDCYATGNTPAGKFGFCLPRAP